MQRFFLALLSIVFGIIGSTPSSYAQLQWKHFFHLGGEGSQFISAMDVSESSIAIGGTYSGEIRIQDSLFIAKGEDDVFVAVFDKSGSILWATTAGSTADDQLNDLRFDQRGRLFAFGSFESAFITTIDTLSTDNGPRGLYALLFAIDGQLSASTAISASGLERAEAILPGEQMSLFALYFSDSLLFGSKTLVSNGAFNGAVLAWDNEQGWLWGKLTSSDQESKIVDIIQWKDQYILAGEFTGSLHLSTDTITASANGEDLFLIAIDTDGKTLWEHTLNGSLPDRAAALAVLEDTVYLSGQVFGNLRANSSMTIQSTGFADDIFLYACNTSTGQPLFLSSFQNEGTEQSTDLIASADGLFLSAHFLDAYTLNGMTYETSSTVFNSLLLQLASNGQLLSVVPLIGDEWVLLSQLASDEDQVWLAGIWTGEANLGGQLRSARLYDGFWGALSPAATATATPLPTSFSLYPNPAYDKVCGLPFPEATQAMAFDSSGSLRHIALKKACLNVGTWPTGSYQLLFVGAQGQVIGSSQLVINR